MEVHVRLGTGLARAAGAARLTCELTDGATVEDLLRRLTADRPDLAGALRAALPVVRGAHVPRDAVLPSGAEVALLTPVAGG